MSVIESKYFTHDKWEAMFGHRTDAILAFLAGISSGRPVEGDVIEFRGGRWRIGKNDVGAGAGGAAGYAHVQSSPAETWTINHNLGREPSVTALSVGGQPLWGDVLHISANQVQVEFSQPLAGRAYCV